MVRALLAFAILAGGSAPLSAPAQTMSVAVPTSDLNLSDAGGRDRLERRIQNAAHQVCGKADPRDLLMSRAVSRCYSGAIASSQPQVARLLARSPVVASR